jgi:hypothetical protein
MRLITIRGLKNDSNHSNFSLYEINPFEITEEAYNERMLKFRRWSFRLQQCNVVLQFLRAKSNKGSSAYKGNV